MAIKQYLRVWSIVAKNKLQNRFLTPVSSVLFIIGKLFNFTFSVLIVFSIFNQVSSIKNYTLPQAIIITLVYGLVDSTTQFLYRALYSFRPILIKGDFDLDLLKPIPSYFRPIFSDPDFLDIPMLIIQIIALIYFLIHYSLVPSIPTILFFMVIFFNGVVLTFAIHLAVAGFAILTAEIDNLVMIYRSLNRTAIVPTDIYNSVFRFVLNYIVPITVIFTVPAKALLNLLSFDGVLYSFIVTYSFFFAAIWFWHFSLRHYTSASS